MNFRGLLTGILFLSAAVSLQAQKPFVFVPQWTPQAQFAGYYAALEKGFYREEGLDVVIEHPTMTTDLDKYLIEKRCDAMTFPLMQAMEVVDRGTPLVNILQTSMNNATVIVSRRGKDPATMHGARVGIWMAGYGQIARCFNIRERMGFDWVLLSGYVNLFIAGALDATVAMSYNEFNLLRQAGLEITEEAVLRFKDGTYNIQEDGVYMTLEGYRRDKTRAEAFARASRRGWEWVAAHPDEALEIVMDYVQAGHVASNRVLQRLMLDEIIRLQMDPQTGEHAFRLRPDMVRQSSELMFETGLLRAPVRYEDLIAR